MPQRCADCRHGGCDCPEVGAPIAPGLRGEQARFQCIHCLYTSLHGCVTEEDLMEIRNPSPGLYNEDLAPARDRRWGAFSIFNVWTSDVHSLWGYYLAASLFLLCAAASPTS